MSGARNVSAFDSIAIDYGTLGDGETKAGEVCPACHGGASKEGSLSVTARGGLLLFTCHRATCTFSGCIGTSGYARSGSGSINSRRRETVVRTYQIDEETLGLLASEYYIPREDLRLAGIEVTEESDDYLGRRVCLPIYGPDSRQRGQSFRSYRGEQPKSIIKLAGEDSIAASWYKWRRKSRSLIVVEDQMSAIKMAPHMHSLALLGTNMSEDKFDEILGGNYEDVFICLDEDATRTALKMVLVYKQRCKAMKVRPLDKDIKNMNTGEFDEFLAYLQN